MPVLKTSKEVVLKRRFKFNYYPRLGRVAVKIPQCFLHVQIVFYQLTDKGVEAQMYGIG